MDLMSAVSSTIASLYGSPQLLVPTALGCLLAFLVVRPLLNALSWLTAHLSLLLLRHTELPPGSLGFLLIEESLHFISSLRQGQLARFLSERTAKFGSHTFKTSLFFYPTVVVQGASANRFLASAENKQDLLNSWPKSTLSLLGKHVPVAVHGAEHKRQRQIMSTCLGPGALQKVIQRADRMTRQHFEATWKDGAQLSITSTLKKHVFSIACSLLAGMEDDSLLMQAEAQFRIWISGFVAVPLNLPGTTFNRSWRARNVLRRQFEEVIDQRRKQVEQNPKGHEDLLSQMILARDDNGNGLTFEELRDLTLFLLFAGHETAATALMFTLKFLEQNPTWLHCLVEEHEAIVSTKQAGEALNWVDVTNMKYTWAVLQETMRLRPPAMGGMKEAQKELKYDGYLIPKGWKVSFFMSSTHENDEYFREASIFDPSRFEVDRMQREVPPPFSFVPFGIGPHSCKGVDFARMTMSLFIHHLIMGKIKWTSLEPQEAYRCFPIVTLAKGYPAVISRH